MMLVVSLILGLIPLAGIAWTIVNGLITTVDGLFMSLILVTLSGFFLLNALWEVRKLQKKPAAPAVQKADK
jgi:uncharacterized membrane protein